MNDPKVAPPAPQPPPGFSDSYVWRICKRTGERNQLCVPVPAEAA